MIGYYKEILEDGSCNISDLNARNIMDEAERNFRRLDDLNRPIADFYQQNPHKAVDKSLWEQSDIEINNEWRAAKFAALYARRAWENSRRYYGQGEWV